MKKLFFAAVLLGVMSFKPASAQVSVSLNLNIGSQPDWGPTGYDHVDYYYMPDIDSYYDVANHQYIYLSGSRWTRSSSLPARYGNYDLYHGYKVVVNEPKPYLHNRVYRAKYAKYKGRKDQPVIRDSHDIKYKKVNTNIHQQPQHGKIEPQRGKPQPQHGKPEKGHGKGDKGHGKGHH